MVDINDYGSLAEGSRCYVQLRAIDDMNDSESWAQGYRYYEQFKVFHDMNYSVSWVCGSKFYDQLRIVNDMNYLGSNELKPLDAMTSSGLWMIWMILGCEPMALNAMNIKVVDDMNDFGLWAQNSRCYE